MTYEPKMVEVKVPAALRGQALYTRKKSPHFKDEFYSEVDVEWPWEPKPCPFCGSTKIEHLDLAGSWKLRCLACDATVTSYTSRESVEDLWNTRA